MPCPTLANHHHTEPVESIDMEVFHQGTHAYLTVPRITMEEVIDMTSYVSYGNLSPLMTLRHTGEIAAMLASDDADVVSMTNVPMRNGSRVTGREATLVHNRGGKR